jgi:hypothetical protein
MSGDMTLRAMKAIQNELWLMFQQVRASYRRVPVLVKAGAVCGLLAGLPIGMMVSAPVGIVFGLSLGASVGIMAGIVMDRDEKRSSHRTKQLDDIIGVTSGSLGAPPSIPPPAPLPDDEDETECVDGRMSEVELKAWVTEWMTPPPPHVR